MKNVRGGGIIDKGAFSGAKKTEGWQERHAERFYEEIRHRTIDIKMIAANAMFTEKAIDEIKQHIFYKEHDLGDGVNARFEPDFEQAQA